MPGVLDFDQRGVVLAENGSIVVTRKSFDPTFLEYLNLIGLCHTESTFLNSLQPHQTFDSIFKEEHIIQHILQSQVDVIDSYHLTDLELDFANRTKKTLYGYVPSAEKYGTKSGFRILCRNLKLPVVDGYEAITDPKEMLLKIDELSKLSNKILIRLDEGVSGAGNFVVYAKTFADKSFSNKFNFCNSIFGKLPQRLKTSGATVETWIDDVISSPSLQFEVQRNKEIILLSMHDQILEGDEKWYTGCEYPSFSMDYSELTLSIISDGYKFMSELRGEGFIGFCGIDVIITKDKYYLVEANVRKPGTTYPREFSKKVFGSLENISYISKDIKHEKLIGKNFDFLFQLLKDLLILNSEKDKSGILVYNTGALEEGGRFDKVIIHKDRNERLKMLIEIENRIGNV